jgi:outer membrane lipoprotein-sorting protein
MRGNSHVRFLGEGVRVTSPPYPTSKNEVNMRHITIVALGLLAAALVPRVHAQQNEAEKLFRAMEKKVTSAKAVRVASDDKVDAPGIRLKWMLVFAEGNKCRLEGSVESEGKVIKESTISDGAKLLSTQRGVPRPKEDAPPDLTTMLQGSILRCGMSVQWLTGLDGKKQGFKIDEDFKVTDFVLGDKEKVGEHEAQVVRYNVFLRGKVKLPVSVWLDAKTKLPLKRVTTIPDKGEQKLTVTETFIQVTLNPKLEPKTFELPKD